MLLTLHFYRKNQGISSTFLHNAILATLGRGLEAWVRANQELVERIEKLGPPSGALPLPKDCKPFGDNTDPNLEKVKYVGVLLLAHGAMSSNMARRQNDFASVDHIVSILKAGHSVMETLAALGLERFKWQCLLLSYDEFGENRPYASWIKSQKLVVGRRDIVVSMDENLRRYLLYIGETYEDMNPFVSGRHMAQSEIAGLDEEYEEFIHAFRTMNSWSAVTRYRSKLGNTFSARTLAKGLRRFGALGPGILLHLAFETRQTRKLAETVFAKGPKAALHPPPSLIRVRPMPSDPEGLKVKFGDTEFPVEAPDVKEPEQKEPKK